MYDREVGRVEPKVVACDGGVSDGCPFLHRYQCKEELGWAL